MKVKYLGPYQSLAASADEKPVRPGEAIDLTVDQLNVLRQHGHQFAEVDDDEAMIIAPTADSTFNEAVAEVVTDEPADEDAPKGRRRS